MNQRRVDALMEGHDATLENSFDVAIAAVAHKKFKGLDVFGLFNP